MYMMGHCALDSHGQKDRAGSSRMASSLHPRHRTPLPEFLLGDYRDIEWEHSTYRDQCRAESSALDIADDTPFIASLLMETATGT